MPDYFKRHVITKDGFDYLAEQQTGLVPELTRAVAGEGFVEWEDLENQTLVTKPVAEMQMDKRVVLDKAVVKLPLRLMNTEITDTVLIRQIGVYAMHPRKGEILYQLVQYSQPQPVPSLLANNGEIYVYNIDIDVMFANTEAAKIPSDPGWFISREEFDATQPTEEVATIKHDLGGIPLVMLYAGEFAFGVGGYGVGPYGGTDITSIPVKLVATDSNTVRVFTIPAYAGEPEISKIQCEVGCMYALLYPGSVKSLTLILR